MNQPPYSPETTYVKPPVLGGITTEQAPQQPEMLAAQDAAANLTMLEQARVDYAHTVNSAQLYGAFFGRKKKLEDVTETYISAWQVHLADRLDHHRQQGQTGKELAKTLSTEISNENSSRTWQELQDWDSRKYARALDRYHNLNRTEKIGAGLVVGAATSGLTLALGGAAVLALGATASVRGVRAWVNRESERVNKNTHFERIRARRPLSTDRDKIFISSVMNTRTADQQIADRLGLNDDGSIKSHAETIMHSELARDGIREQVKAVNKSIAISVGSIALGATLSHANDIKNAISSTGNVPKIASLELPKMAGLTEKVQDVAHKISSIGVLSKFVTLGDIKIAAQVPGQTPRDTIQRRAEPIITKTKDRASARWQTVKDAPKSLWVRSNSSGDYSYFPNKRHNSYWELAKQTLRLNGESRPTVSQINKLKNAAAVAQGKDPATATLDMGDKVTFRARMIRAALGRS